jgi:tetratricopeptide (TPR) repeat protein
MAEQINLSSELLRLGAYDEAAQTLEASLSEGERLGLTYAVAVTLNNLCVARLGLGRLDEALLAGRKAVATSAKGRHAMLEASSRDSTARVLLAGGHVQEAVSEAERALTLLPAAHPVALTARTLLADALLARRGAGDAALALAHARNVVEDLDTDPSRCREPASTLRVRIDALEANGLVDEARQAREEARGWVLERAGRIQSEHYRRTFEGALDVARILKSPRGSGAE